MLTFRKKIISLDERVFRTRSYDQTHTQLRTDYSNYSQVWILKNIICVLVSERCQNNGTPVISA